MDLVTNVVTGSNADRLLLLLHGYGADERDLGGLLGYLDPNGTYAAVLPRGLSGEFSHYDASRCPSLSRLVLKYSAFSSCAGWTIGTRSPIRSP